MVLRMDYQYYVVEFLHPPYCDIDQYVCIPDSWIQLREIADQMVVFKFPVENLSITKKRVKDGEDFSDDWSIYVAEVKYGTATGIILSQLQGYCACNRTDLVNTTGLSCCNHRNSFEIITNVI